MNRACMYRLNERESSVGVGSEETGYCAFPVSSSAAAVAACPVCREFFQIKHVRAQLVFNEAHVQKTTSLRYLF